MRHYCTLFDKNYLTKGLAMYESLRRHSGDFALHILALDPECEAVLRELNLPKAQVRIRSLFEILYRAGHFTDNTRSWQQFCWGMASALLNVSLRDFEHGVTYLDADLFFFSDPAAIFEEIGDRSIGIVEHRFIPSKRHLAVNGRFNVGMIHVKNTPTGRQCMSRWAAQVRERCDESTCGDQKYLDEWPDRYGAEVCIIQNIGANVAPWNAGNYGVTEGPCVDGRPILWYHFHEYLHGERLTNYELRPEDIELIYKPYIAAIEAASEQIARVSLQTR